MDDPLGLFLTWGTYGTWLPGDSRGWTEYGRGWQLPDPIRELEAAAIMTDDACVLSSEQRKTVESQIDETCRIGVGCCIRSIVGRTTFMSSLALVIQSQRKSEWT